MPKVHLIGHTYSILNKTQFIILVGILIISVLGIWKIVVEANSKETIIYKSIVVSEKDIALYGASKVIVPEGSTFDNSELNGRTDVKLNEACPNGVRLIDMWEQIIECN